MARAHLAGRLDVHLAHRHVERLVRHPPRLRLRRRPREARGERRVGELRGALDRRARELRDALRARLDARLQSRGNQCVINR